MQSGRRVAVWLHEGLGLGTLVGKLRFTAIEASTSSVGSALRLLCYIIPNDVSAESTGSHPRRSCEIAGHSCGVLTWYLFLGWGAS